LSTKGFVSFFSFLNFFQKNYCQKRSNML